MTASDQAKKRIADYLARRARANGFDKEEIHTFDAGCNGQTVLLTGDLTALLAEIARLHHQINEATDENFIWGAMDNVHDDETTLDDYASAVSRAQRAALKGDTHE